MITARQEFAAAVVDHTIYIVGGANGNGRLASVESLDMSDTAAVWVQRRRVSRAGEEVWHR